MKIITNPTLKVIVTCFCAMLTFAQINAQTNLVKTNLISWAKLSPNIHYERPITPVTSAEIGITFLTGFTTKITGTAFTSEGVATETVDFKLKGFNITPSVRFYTGGVAPTGFYVSPFIRLYNYKLNVDDYPYERNETGEIVPVSGDGKVTGIGGGLTIGGQWITNNNIVIDIYGGFGAATGTADFTVADPDLTAEEYADMKVEIDNELNTASIGVFDNTFDKIKVTASENSATIDLENAILPMGRLGVVIGYAF